MAIARRAAKPARAVPPARKRLERRRSVGRRSPAERLDGEAILRELPPEARELAQLLGEIWIGAAERAAAGREVVPAD